MAKVLILFAHPAMEKSRVHTRLAEHIPRSADIRFHDLYERYPDFDIDVPYEQRLLQQHSIGRGPKVAIPPQVFEDLHLDPEKAYTTVANIIESSDDLKHIANELAPHH